MIVEKIHKAKDIAILWFGSEGQSAYRFLIRQGVEPTQIVVLDWNRDIELPRWVRSVLWDEYLDFLDEYDVIIKTPGISPYQEKTRDFQDKMVSTTQLFLSLYKGKVIAVTWTKWKSTMVTLLYNGLLAAGKTAVLVGNIGTPVLDLLDELHSKDYDYVVFEMSSFMIQSLSEVRIFAAVYVNLYQAHMDWHGGLDRYRQDKLKLATYADHVVVYNPSYLQHKQFFDDLEVGCIRFGDGGNFYEADHELFHNGEKLGRIEGLRLLWRHNRTNICGLVALAHSVLGLHYEQMKPGFQQTQPLPHRLNDVGTFKGIRFFDDSIATTPDSTIQALETMKEEKLEVWTMFLWGFAQEFDYSCLIDSLISQDIKNFVFFPDAGDVMKGLLDAKWYEYNGLVTRDMKEAVKFAYAHATSGQVVLLSCASVSFGIWKSYKERGDQFITYVKELWQQ